LEVLLNEFSVLTQDFENMVRYYHIENKFGKTIQAFILTFNLVQSFHDLSNILVVRLRNSLWLLRNWSWLEAISILGSGSCLQEMLLILEELFL